MLKTASDQMSALAYDGVCEGGFDRGKNYIVGKQHVGTKV